MAVKVAIDAGHGGFDNGAVYNGRREKDDNLEIALELGRILQNNGIEVAYTRTDDRYDSPVQKAQLANATGADYLVSIHRNAAYAPNTYSGVQTLVYDNSGVRKELAEAINNELEDIGFNNINVETRKDLGILRRSNMPAVLVEVGFIDNDYDNSVLDASVTRTAQAIADGILDVVGKQAVPASAVGVREADSGSLAVEGNAVSDSDGQNAEDGLVRNNYESRQEGSVRTGKNPMPETNSTVDGVKPADMAYSVGKKQDRDDREYKLQMGLFRVFRYAKDLERELAGQGYDTDLEKEGEFFVVYVEGFNSLDEASKAEKELKKKGYDNFVVEVKD